MASTTLYPPIVNDYEPAFVATPQNSQALEQPLKVYFYLSSIGAPTSNWWVHASVIRKDGVLVVDTTDDTGTGPNRLRKTGTILNINAHQVDSTSGLYYIELFNKDLKSLADFGSANEPIHYKGWIPGWEYKIQLRISEEACINEFEKKQEEWLQTNSDKFSEWSTICFVKAIGDIEIISNYDDEEENINRYKISGNFINSLQGVTEDYYSCQITLFDVTNNNILEKSDIIYNTMNNNYFEYVFKTAFQNNNDYKVQINYITENDYKGEKPYTFCYTETPGTANGFHISTIEQINSPLVGYTTVSQEEDEGRVALKIYYEDEDELINFPNKVYIRRASSKDNFTSWEDIKYIKINGISSTATKEENATVVNNSDIFYDYTIESGIWYKYAIQPLDVETGNRLAMNIITNPIIRVFDFGYFLGFGERQLKLEFDNTIGNFSTKVSDGLQETIGSKYPFINRSNSIYYKTFGINGLISFNMDEQNTFLQEGKKTIYKYDNIVNLYNNYNNARGIKVYDYTFERDFRNEVSDFLYRDKPLLFKSPTEGNIVVRLMNINFTPNQTLSRLVYSFAGTANEIADSNFTTYNKYGFVKFNMELGQLQQEPDNRGSESINYPTPTF